MCFVSLNVTEWLIFTCIYCSVMWQDNWLIDFTEMDQEKKKYFCVNMPPYHQYAFIPAILKKEYTV